MPQISSSFPPSPFFSLLEDDRGCESTDGLGGVQCGVHAGGCGPAADAVPGSQHGTGSGCSGAAPGDPEPAGPVRGHTAGHGPPPTDAG